VITKLERNVYIGFRILVVILQFTTNIKVLYMVTKTDQISGTDDLDLIINI